MTPRLFPGTATNFTTLGQPLTDMIRCEVTEVRNGEYTLEAEYPTSGELAEDIAVDKIILAKPHDNATQEEPFIIVSVASDIGGRMKISAQHISYRLNSIIIKPVTITASPISIWDTMVSDGYRLGVNPFTFYSNITASKAFTSEKCTPLRTLIGGGDPCMLNLFGGELEWNRFEVRLKTARGANNGVVIAYGKNITGLDYEIDLSDYWNGVVCYYQKDNNRLNSSIRWVSDGLSYIRPIVIDATNEFNSVPTGSQLNAWGDAYVAANYRAPRVTVNVSFVPLWQTKEYEAYYELEHVGLCDTVKISYPPLGTDLTAKVVKTVYDVLQERYTAIQVGTPSTTLSDTIDGIIKELKRT